MTNKNRLIHAEAVRDALYDADAITMKGVAIINQFPTVDAVPVGVLDQVRWERDVAIKQLEDHGIPFGGIAPDVVKVVRCRDCQYWFKNNGHDRKGCPAFAANIFLEDGMDDATCFCSIGERRKDNG